MCGQPGPKNGGHESETGIGGDKGGRARGGGGGRIKGNERKEKMHRCCPCLVSSQGSH